MQMAVEISDRAAADPSSASPLLDHRLDAITVLRVRTDVRAKSGTRPALHQGPFTRPIAVGSADRPCGSAQLESCLLCGRPTVPARVFDHPSRRRVTIGLAMPSSSRSATASTRSRSSPSARPGDAGSCFCPLEHRPFIRRWGSIWQRGARRCIARSAYGQRCGRRESASDKTSNHLAALDVPTSRRSSPSIVSTRGAGRLSNYSTVVSLDSIHPAKGRRSRSSCCSDGNLPLQ